MAVQKEIWASDIVSRIPLNNPHFNLCRNSDQHVLAGKVVHRANAGAAPDIKKNRTILPATVTTRTDTDVTYSLNEFTSDPIKISNAETIELAYDKRQDVLLDTQTALNESIGTMLLDEWSPQKPSRVLATSGAAVAAHLQSATGDRKKITLADLKSAQKLFNRDGVPQEGRYCMMDADMLDQLTEELNTTQWRDFSRAYNESEGIVGKLYSFTILQRGYVLRYDGSAKINPEAEYAATHSAAALCWHKDSVERAVGDVVFYANEGDPTYYGDIYSALVRASGHRYRSDEKGICVIAQASV